VLDAMRRLVTDQIGMVTTGFQPGDRFQDVLIWLQTAMNVTVVKLWPSLMTKRPAFKNADANLREFGLEVLKFHRENKPEDVGRPRDLIDDMLDNLRPDGQPFTEQDLLSQTYGPFFAGIDTLASTIAFGLYSILKQPELRARIEAEAAELFGSEKLDLMQLRKMPVLHAAAIETLRRYPVAPFTPRNVTEPFDFAGFHFEHGTEIMIAQTITHLLPEYYKDPYTFNADRHLDGGDNPPVGVFAPYTLGAHTCLGAGMAESLLMLNLAAILHYTSPSLSSPDYVAPIKSLPLPNPGLKFTLTMN
jgi:cytochrome P450